MMLHNYAYIDLDLETKENGYTPISSACMAGNFDVVCMLAENGADVNTKANLRIPPFWSDMERGEILISDVSPLSYALNYPNYKYRTEYNRPDTPDQNIIDLLERSGARV